jgi:hypothetical protein
VERRSSNDKYMTLLAQGRWVLTDDPDRIHYLHPETG